MIDDEMDSTVVDSETAPFREIQPYQESIQTIREMRRNLDELEKSLEEARWIALGGRGMYDAEQVQRTAAGLEGWQEDIVDKIAQLPDPYDQRERWRDDE